MKFSRSAIWIIVLAILVCNGDLMSQTSANSELTRAREKAKTAVKKFNTLKRLSQKGSASSKQVRDADLLRKLALLDLSTLTTPEKSQDNALLRARFMLKYRTEELAVTTSLYQRGSTSKITYNRALSAKEVAEARVKAILSITETQRKMQSIKAANSKLAVAKKEFETGTKLFKSGSISQTVMDQLKSNLEIANAELAEVKKSLGAKASVRQQ